MFLGTLDKVYIVDKVENNPAQVNGHPAWAQGYHPRLILAISLFDCGQNSLWGQTGRGQWTFTQTHFVL